MYNKISIIIPALNPNERILNLIKELITYKFANIIVVNDGSDKNFASIFEEIEAMEKCFVIRHLINRGKGRALKSAFEYVLENTDSEGGNNRRCRWSTCS